MVAPLAAAVLRLIAGQIIRGALDDNKKPSIVGYIAFTDWRDLLREINKIEPQYARDMKRNFKKIASPMRTAISRAIPKTHPTSGVHVRGAKNVSGFAPVVVPGRLSWSANAQNGNIQPRHTTIRLTKARSFKKIGQYGQMSIVKVDVDNAAVVMADMAGRSKKWVNKRPMTRPYKYGGGGAQTGKYGSKAQLVTMRQHRINGQGMGMIKALNRGKGALKGDASRWIWPTANKHLPNVRYQINDVIRQANKFINERMKTR
jgi:hypothetical protein